MAVYKVVTVPNEVLRTKAKEVTRINDGLLRLLENMKDTMYEFDGIGLAAPQIGVLKRVIVVDPGDNYMELINPEIIYKEGEQTGREGCLSIPGVYGKVSRAKKVIVKALNRHNETITVEAEDLLARVLQHEIDHLDGILFIDKATEIIKEK
ncbi:peptide deformylase [Thermosyntropha sp.]|uniref:peptide deformylase n=1 Tax=Thermosyntropha sp. TaxID=2740820 RepID=UPI0025D3902B|nr:peptide deformylase [Thermosyntropha sp.]MBO8158519.1 peptide deformylase [Thermosyntropha sp.]